MNTTIRQIIILAIAFSILIGAIAAVVHGQLLLAGLLMYGFGRLFANVDANGKKVSK